MPNRDLTSISIILDRSGSMQPVRKQTMDGINAFLEKQRVTPGRCLVSLIQFDDRYEVNYLNRPVQEVEPLTFKTYEPRGGTALLDAIGRTINELGKSLAEMPEQDQPGAVLVVIQTDGHENASFEFTLQKVNQMIAHQREKYSWDFVFLGAGQDAIATAASMGIQADKAMAYSGTQVGTANVFASAANYSTRLRSAGARGMSLDGVSFTAEEREESAKE